MPRYKPGDLLGPHKIEYVKKLNGDKGIFKCPYHAEPVYFEA